MYIDAFHVVGKATYNERQLRFMLKKWGVKENDDEILRQLKTKGKAILGPNLRALTITGSKPVMPPDYKEDMTVNEQEADLMRKWFNAVHDLNKDYITDEDKVLNERILKFIDKLTENIQKEQER